MRDRPRNLNSLEARINNLARDQERPLRRVQRAIANTVVGQMLPPGVVKGGTAMKARLGELASRFTPGLRRRPRWYSEPPSAAAGGGSSLSEGEEAVRRRL